MEMRDIIRDRLLLLMSQSSMLDSSNIADKSDKDLRNHYIAKIDLSIRAILPSYWTAFPYTSSFTLPSNTKILSYESILNLAFSSTEEGRNILANKKAFVTGILKVEAFNRTSIIPTGGITSLVGRSFGAGGNRATGGGRRRRTGGWGRIGSSVDYDKSTLRATDIDTARGSLTYNLDAVQRQVAFTYPYGSDQSYKITFAFMLLDPTLMYVSPNHTDFIYNLTGIEFIQSELNLLTMGAFSNQDYSISADQLQSILDRFVEKREHYTEMGYGRFTIARSNDY